MLLLDYENVLLKSILTERFSGASPQSIDQVVSDFDGVTFHISTPNSKTQILVSLSVKCYRELVRYGAEAVLQREYGNYITTSEAGYDFSILIDLENLPSTAEERDELIRRVSLLKRNAMAAPFEKAFDEFAELSAEAAKYTSESAPKGVAEGGEVMAIHYRDEEAIYIKASHDRVTVIFSTLFRDETDRIFGKVFLQEFVDARRRAIQNAPQVLFRSDPPLELQGLKGVGKTGEKGEIGFITFGRTNPCFVNEINMLTAKSYSHATSLPKEETKVYRTSKLLGTIFTIISRLPKHTSTPGCEDVQQTSCKFSTEQGPKMRKRNERLPVEELSEYTDRLLLQQVQ